MNNLAEKNNIWLNRLAILVGEEKAKETFGDPRFWRVIRKVTPENLSNPVMRELLLKEWNKIYSRGNSNRNSTQH